MAAPTKTSFTIGTRKSALALAQTHLVLEAIKTAYPDYEFKVFSQETAGDLNTVMPLKDFTTKNLWTEELEQHMIAGHVDFIAHSLKGGHFISPPPPPNLPRSMLIRCQTFQMSPLSSLQPVPWAQQLRAKIAGMCLS